jgi:thymidylate kinase
MRETPAPTASPPVHPAVATAFAALERGGVSWCVLRGERDLDRAQGDVDLLVSEADVAVGAAVLRGVGFVELPSWGRGSHRFFLAYDETRDDWIKLDVVTKLAFGANGEIDSGLAEACLARTIVDDGIPLLSPADRFWVLLLHCLLDRSDVPERHRAALSGMVEGAGAESPIATWFSRRMPAGWTHSLVLEAVRESDWHQVGQLGEDLRTAERRREGAIPRRRLAGHLLRRLTKLRTLLVGRGASIALLGPDGAGKTTLAEGLARTFHLPVRTIYMGLYGAGPSGRSPRGMAGRLGRLWAGYVRGRLHVARGRLVVYDRWSLDARLASGRAGRRATLRRWLLSHAVPQPDLVILLDVTPALLASRKDEHDLQTLTAQRMAYLELARRTPHVRVLSADRDQESVRRAVTALVFAWLRDHRHARASRR